MKNIFLLSLALLSINAANADIYYSPSELGKLNQANLRDAKKLCYKIALKIGSMEARQSQFKKLPQTTEVTKAIEEMTGWLTSKEVENAKKYCGANE